MESKLTRDFERIVMEHKSSIYLICYMFVESRADADDLFQEVLINLWNGFRGFRGDAEVSTWIYRVSMNTCISYKRKKRIRTVPLDISQDVIANNAPESRQTRQLHHRISALEPIDRAIVLLWLENLPYDEIAAIVGTTPTAIGVRLVRIKDKLKSLSEKH